MSLHEWLKYIQYIKQFLWKLPFSRVTRAHFAWNFWEILMNFSTFFGLSAILPLFLNLMTGVIELQVMPWIFSACHDYMGQVDKFLGVKKNPENAHFYQNLKITFQNTKVYNGCFYLPGVIELWSIIFSKIWFQFSMTLYNYWNGVKKHDTVICLQSSLTFWFWTSTKFVHSW